MTVRTRVAVLALDGVVAFDLGIPPQVFGAARRRRRRVRSTTSRVCLDGRARSAHDAGFAIVPDHGLDALADGRHRDRARAPSVAGPRDRRHAARRRRPPRSAPIRPRRPDRLDLHRRLRAGRRRPARRPPGHHALGAGPTQLRAALPAVERRPRRAVRRRRRRAHLGRGRAPASTSACTSSAATTAARWPTGRPGAAWCRRGGTAARRSTSSGPCRARRRATAAARAWAAEHLGDRRAGAGRHAGMSVRTFTRRFRDETGQPGGWLIQQRVRHARLLLETTDLPSTSRRRRGSAPPPRCGAHLLTRFGVSPSAYRRTFRGLPARVATVHARRPGQPTAPHRPQVRAVGQG